MKRITFITTGQPTTNPRLVKEAETLSSLGYKVKVICCFYQSWAQKFDPEITNKNPGMYIYCGGDPIGNKTLYNMTRLRQKICKKLFKLIKVSGVPENAISRAHSEALLIAKKIKTDLYIAHNLGALPTAVKAAKYNGIKVGYDAEDMHSGQFETNNDSMYLLNKYVEEKYFKQTDYFTAASPSIAQNYKHIYPYLSPVVINNVFPKTDLSIKQIYNTDQPLKLFWFSQTIGNNRGLDDIINAIQLLKNTPIELHLLGSLPQGTQKEYINNLTADKTIPVFFHKPISPDQLIPFATQFDIGLALEPAFCMNNDLALSNKIFTYLQAGLAIIVSNTTAQQAFIEQYPSVGKLYKKGDSRNLAGILSYFNSNRDALWQARESALTLARTELNWENESVKFITLVKQTIQESE